MKGCYVVTILSSTSRCKDERLLCCDYLVHPPLGVKMKGCYVVTILSSTSRCKDERLLCCDYLVIHL